MFISSFDWYRDYVISTLPQLKSLDGVDVGKAERILAVQKRKEILPKILKQEMDHAAARERERAEAEAEIEAQRADYEDPAADRTENRKKFFASKSRHTPEYRREAARKTYEFEVRDAEERDPFREDDAEAAARRARNRPRRLFADDGTTPLNVNQPRIDFDYDDSDPESVVLELKLYKVRMSSIFDGVVSNIDLICL